MLDYGVEITDVTETTDDLTSTLSGIGLTIEQLIEAQALPKFSTSYIVVNEVVFTLSTGATITVVGPAGDAYRFQIGEGDALYYNQIREQFTGVTGDDPYIVDSIGDLPANLPETLPDDEIDLVVSGVDDVVVLGGEFNFADEANGLGGHDYFVISKYLSANMIIRDTANINTIVLDYGVEITDVTETTDDLTSTLSGIGLTIEQLIEAQALPKFSTSYIVVNEVEFTLSTGATINVAGPAGDAYRFQIGEGDALYYNQIREQFVGASDISPFTVPLPEAGPPPEFTLPDTGTTYFRYDASAADTQDHGFYRFTADATASLDDDSHDLTPLITDSNVLDGSNLIILDGEIDRDYASNQALTGGGGDDVFRLDLATIGDGVTGPLTLHIRDLVGENILHLIADGDGDNLITGVDYNALLRTLTLTITAPDGTEDQDTDRDDVAEIVLNAQNFGIYVGDTLLDLPSGLALDDLPATVALEVV